jgi:hypothetical protein
VCYPPTSSTCCCPCCRSESLFVISRMNPLFAIDASGSQWSYSKCDVIIVGDQCSLAVSGDWVAASTCRSGVAIVVNTKDLQRIVGKERLKFMMTQIRFEIPGVVAGLALTQSHLILLDSTSTLWRVPYSLAREELSIVNLIFLILPDHRRVIKTSCPSVLELVTVWRSSSHPRPTTSLQIFSVTM